jgi:uncharacterized DUF497 family protein
MISFQWDEGKNKENVRKHGIDFTDARGIFDHPMLVDIDSRKDYGETRYIGIGLLKNFVVVVVYTERNNDIIRIISSRRAAQHERERFTEHLRNQLGTSENDV